MPILLLRSVSEVRFSSTPSVLKCRLSGSPVKGCDVCGATPLVGVDDAGELAASGPAAFPVPTPPLLLPPARRFLFLAASLAASTLLRHLVTISLESRATPPIWLERSLPTMTPALVFYWTRGEVRSR